MGYQPSATVGRGELLRERKQGSTVSGSLHRLTNGHAPEDRLMSRDVDADDTNGIPLVQQQLGVIPGSLVVGTMLVVDAELSSCLEQHLAADVMVDAPRVDIGRRDKFVFAHYHDWLLVRA